MMTNTNNGPKTIRRNASKKIAALFAKATDCRCYSLSNGFVGSEVGADWIAKQFAQFNFAKLTDDGQGNYRVRLHSNCWYEFRA